MKDLNDVRDKHTQELLEKIIRTQTEKLEAAIWQLSELGYTLQRMTSGYDPARLRHTILVDEKEVFEVVTTLTVDPPLAVIDSKWLETPRPAVKA